MRNSSPPVVPVIALRQGGVFTAEQARAEGWTSRTLRRRIVARRWAYVAGRALAEARPSWTPFQLAMAAHLSLRDVVISHGTAAALHGFPHPVEDDDALDCHVTISGRRPPPGLRIRTHLMSLESAEIEPGSCGLRLTTPARTAFDCLATYPFGAALDLWAWVTSRQIVSHADLLAAIERRRQWKGTTQLRRIARLCASGAVSQAEFRMHQLLHRAKVKGWTANVRIMDGKTIIAIADLLFEQARVIIEIDGWRAHKSHAAFITDRRRQNRLLAAGYRVLRFTWPDLRDRPAEVIAEIRRAVQDRVGLEV